MGSSLTQLCCTVDTETGQVRPLIGDDSHPTPKYQNYTDIAGAPTDKKWYHAKISDHEAERRLKIGSEGNNNSYLVYDDPRKRGQYILIVINNGAIFRWSIIRRQSDGLYILGNNVPGVEGFASVRELIKAHRGFRGKPIKTDKGQTLTLSRSYVYFDP